MTVRDIATEEVVTASPDDTVADLVERMDEEDVGTVVIAEGGEPISIVSDRRIAMALREHDDVASLTASDVMTEDLVTVQADAEMLEALDVMASEAIRRVPVVDDGDELTGIVSLDDVIVAESEQSNKISEVVEQQAGPM